MGFTVEKKQFEKAIAAVMPAVSARSTLPILSGIRLTGAETRYALEATDLELRISLQSAASNGGSFESAVVPAKALAKAVKSITGEELSVSFKEGEGQPTVEISSAKRSVVIESHPSADFPELPERVKWEAVCWFEPGQFAEALTRVTLCATSDESRPVLTGVQFNFREERIELVGTDSYRLGVLSVPTEKMGDLPDHSPIVPARVLKLLAKQLKKHEGRGIVYVGTVGEEQSSHRLIQFSFGAISWITRQIEGEYPNWRQLIPGESGSSLEVDADELAASVKGAAAIRSQKSTPVRVSLGDSCVIRMQESQAANLVEKLDKATYSPNGVGALEIAFNPDFLLDAISFVGEDKVRMRANDAYKPALFHGENGGRYVLMPVRLPR